MRTSTLVVAVLALAGCGPGPVEVPLGQEAQGLTQVTGFGSNPGNLLMFTHVPPNLPANAPLVVVLHGCTQSASAMESSGWSAASDAQGFFVVYAQQQSSNNSSSCFNWFVSGDIARGQGEALSIKQMVDWVKANYSINAGRVYATGFSAGAYFSSVLAATYPDVFAAVAVNSGGPYLCATTQTDAFSCMNPGVTKSAQAWGDLVRGAFSGYSGPRPRVALWHGNQDFTVAIANMTESVKQWTNVFGADQTADVQDTVSGQAHAVYKDSSGNAVVETYTISGMGHAVPVDPQFSFPGGGPCGTTGQYFVDQNICAAYLQESFFGLLGGGGGGDTTPPTVSLTAPANGATVSGTITLSATASDNVGVSRVELSVDGSVVGTSTAPPYQVSWNTASVGNGGHTVTAKAFDAAGNSASSSSSVTVSNAGGTTTVSFSSIAGDDGYVKAFSDGTGAAVGAFTTLAVGRGTDGKLNRAIYSFDTSSLPDGASIVSATLTVTWSSGSGSPWSDPAGNSMVADVKAGVFGAAATTEVGDWSAAADASAAASIAAFSSGTKTSSGFGAAGLSAVNRTGKTQVRLRFSQNQGATAYVFLTEGNGATLTVTYQ
ncbi:MAG TPA: PHB depolymerase family esterase [Myxococcaceae bacterium]|nr:PHB depolymerase family esterase [Myxococcaceae bacterium]